MPKRRRLLNSPKKQKPVEHKEKENDLDEKQTEREVRSARGRLMGALLEALEGDSSDEEPQKRIRHRTPRKPANFEDQGQYSKQYVLKLFDRSVDLSQFEEDSPLYPICRAWIVNQPKANYRQLLLSKKENIVEEESKDEFKESVKLPGPTGSPISRIPELLPEQKTRSKNDINLDYTTPSFTREQLLNFHLNRWSAVRQAWLEQAALVESRYSETQEVLNKITSLKPEYPKDS